MLQVTRAALRWEWARASLAPSGRGTAMPGATAPHHATAPRGRPARAVFGTDGKPPRPHFSLACFPVCHAGSREAPTTRKHSHGRWSANPCAGNACEAGVHARSALEKRRIPSTCQWECGSQRAKSGLDARIGMAPSRTLLRGRRRTCFVRGKVRGIWVRRQALAGTIQAVRVEAACSTARSSTVPASCRSPMLGAPAGCRPAMHEATGSICWRLPADPAAAGQQAGLQAASTTGSGSPPPSPPTSFRAVEAGHFVPSSGERRC